MDSPHTSPVIGNSGSHPETAERGDGTRTATMPPGYESPPKRPDGGSSHSPNDSPSPKKQLSLPVRLWRTIKSIYYASSPAWQFLKSGALFLFGLFCWSAANLLLSYEPTWHWPYFFMAYGFLLTPYGPFTHFVLVPHVIPWLRRRPQDSWLYLLGSHLTLTSLTLFFSAVLLMGLYPPSVMQIDFRASGNTGQGDVNPTLVCSDAPDVNAVKSCHLEQTDGVGAITVESGGTHRLKRTDPPFSFSLQKDDLVEVVGQHQFQVVVRNKDGVPLRRFTRSVRGVDSR